MFCSYTLASERFSEANTAPELHQPEAFNLKKRNGIGDFSFFSKPVQNVIPSGVMSIRDAFQSIVSEQYATPTRVLRALPNKETARHYKARNFDYVCFSGVFTKRCEAGLVRHSNLLTVDFDHVPRLLQLKNHLISNPFFETILAFISPSGDGLKWIIKIDLEKFSHLQWFQAVASYIRYTYHLPIDQSGKDVSRCCFLPYDPDAYLNEKYIS